jgi:hypothetical protein
MPPGVDTGDDDFVESSEASGSFQESNLALQGIVAGSALIGTGIPAPDEF